MCHRMMSIGLVVAILSPPVAAFSIDSVTVLPTSDIAPGDPVALKITITTPSAPASLYQATAVLVQGDQVLVDVYPDGGLLTMLDFLSETVQLGVLEPGRYEYTVELHPAFKSGWGTRTVVGSFTVGGDGSPIPAAAGWSTAGVTLLLAIVGACAVARRGGWRGIQRYAASRGWYGV